MIVAESHRSRRLIGRLDRGADLLPALAELCSARGIRCAELRAFGTLEEVDLREFDQRARAFRPARRFTTPFTLVQLCGNLAEREGALHVEAQVALAREGDNGIELVGGHLQRARVYAVDFVVDAFDDLLLRRAMDPGTGLALFAHAIPLGEPAAAPAVRAPAPVAAPAAEAPRISFEAAPQGWVAEPRASREAETHTSWEEVASASASLEESSAVAAAEPADPIRAGDFLEHPKFGRCEVERIEGDQEFAQVRLRNARLVRLSLDVLTIERASDENGKRIFRVVAR